MYCVISIVIWKSHKSFVPLKILFCTPPGVTLVLSGYQVKLPADIFRYAAQLQLHFPSEDKIRQIVLDEAREWQKKHNGKQVRTDSKTLDRLVSNLRGMTESDVKRLVKGAIYVDGAITSSDIDSVNQSKFQLMNMNNILSYEYDTAQFAEVGGLENLKRWLAERRDAFLQAEGQMDTPKGMMLLGVQGGGKSLAAKAIAGLWHVPLLRLDMAALYNKYHGETRKESP